ncbi:unnamed protein product, partial [Didymodactylos carnosus]
YKNYRGKNNMSSTNWSENINDDIVLLGATTTVQSKPIKAQVSLEILTHGRISVDWSTLEVFPSTRHFLIHYKMLNENKSKVIRMPKNMRNFILHKIEPGCMYEIHVCAVDRRGFILSTTECACIQVGAADLPRPYETKFIVNNGIPGKQYTFQIEFSRKNGVSCCSPPYVVNWPGTTVPRLYYIFKNKQNVLIYWKNSLSIGDGEIENYKLHCYNSKQNSSVVFGPYSPECREILIKDLEANQYIVVLEINLKNSDRSLYSKPLKVNCAEIGDAPNLSYEYIDSENRQELEKAVCCLLPIRDKLLRRIDEESVFGNSNSQQLLNDCETLIYRILVMLSQLTNRVQLNLIIQTDENTTPCNRQLMINGKLCSTIIPWFVKEVPLELPVGNMSYELAVANVSDSPHSPMVTSKKIFVDQSEQFTFFCMHFEEQYYHSKTCSYFETFQMEKTCTRPLHEGLLKHYQILNKKNEENENTKPVHEIFSLDGVPTCIFLDYN